MGMFSSDEQPSYSDLWRKGDEIKKLKELLKEVLESNMAMREEDEGNISPLLAKVRSIIGITESDNQNG
jgi:hypothetical protein